MEIDPNTDLSESNSEENLEKIEKQAQIKRWCLLVLSDKKLDKKNALREFDSIMEVIPEQSYSSRDFLNLMNGDVDQSSSRRRTRSWCSSSCKTSRICWRRSRTRLCGSS